MLKYIDPVYCKLDDRRVFEAVYACLSYQKFLYAREGHEHKKFAQTASMLDRRSGNFPAGLLKKVVEELERLQLIEPGDAEIAEILKDVYYVEASQPPSLPGITLRPDQLELLHGLSNYQRGIIHSATGTGKTVLAAAIHSMFGCRTLFLCHTIDLVMQAAKEFRKFGFVTHELGGGIKELPILGMRDIVVSTVQTFSKKVNILDYIDTFGCIIVDECHHVIKHTGQYAHVFNRSMAGIRIGFTGTLPEGKKNLLTLEGLLGPVLGEFSISDGVKAGVLSEPIIEWIPVPGNDNLYGYDKYHQIYKHCVVENRARNRLVMSEAAYEIEQGNSVLIIVKEISHGENLVAMGHILGISPEFIYGKTDRQTRSDVKQALEDKDVKCVISTAWKEGVNIRSLNCVINAAGGKSEIATIQAIGRGLRTTEDKNKVIIKDFIDPYKYLSHHLMLRLTTYARNGWRMRGVAP